MFRAINSEQNIFLVGQRCLLVRTMELFGTIYHSQTKTFSHNFGHKSRYMLLIKKKKKKKKKKTKTKKKKLLKSPKL